MSTWFMRHVLGGLTPLQISRLTDFLFDLTFAGVTILVVLAISGNPMAAKVTAALWVLPLLWRHVVRRDRLITRFYSRWNRVLYAEFDEDHDISSSGVDPDFVMKAMVFNSKLSHTKMRYIIQASEWVQSTNAMTDNELAHALDDAPPEIADILRDFLRD